MGVSWFKLCNYVRDFETQKKGRQDKQNGLEKHIKHGIKWPQTQSPRQDVLVQRCLKIRVLPPSVDPATAPSPLVIDNRVPLPPRFPDPPPPHPPDSAGTPAAARTRRASLSRKSLTSSSSSYRLVDPVTAPKNLMPETLSRASRGTRKFRRSVLLGMLVLGMANAATNVVGVVVRASEGGGGYGSAMITCGNIWSGQGGA